MVSKQHLLLIGAGIFICILYLFGKTSLPPKEGKGAAMKIAKTPALVIDSYLDSLKKNLSREQQLRVAVLEQPVKRGALKELELNALQTLADYYKDTLRDEIGFLYYNYQKAKLENSQKSLTFAAQLFLPTLRTEHDASRLAWKSDLAIELFEIALKGDPENTDLKVGLGSSYIFGRGQSGDPAETMQGIQQLLSVVRADSANMKAQMALGIGGYLSGQYDKAIQRFLTVVTAQPANLEAVAFLADTYAASGNKKEAVAWYEKSIGLADNAEYETEVRKRIATLR